MSKKSDLTLYFLNSSRAIRVAWLLEELDLPYQLVATDRAKNGLAPPEFKSKIPSPLAKSPTVTDQGGTVVVTESGAIVEYLVETYDATHKVWPTDVQSRAKVREWLHAAEGTFMLHSMAILYTRWRMPESGRDVLPELEKGLSANVHKNFDWLESELKAQKEKGSQWLVGQNLTAADITLQFSIEFIMERKLGVGGVGEGKWPEVEAWLKRTKETPSYKKAVAKTGYTLDGDFRK